MKHPSREREDLCFGKEQAEALIETLSPSVHPRIAFIAMTSATSVGTTTNHITLMDTNIVIFVVKLFVGMVAIGTGGTLIKKATEDAGKIKLMGGKKNA